MFKRTLFFITPLALLIGCSGNVQNPSTESPIATSRWYGTWKPA